MKLKPQRGMKDVEYPQLDDFEDGRRRLLKLLTAGGLGLVTGGLIGCSSEEATELEPPPRHADQTPRPQYRGRIRVPRPDRT